MRHIRFKPLLNLTLGIFTGISFRLLFFNVLLIVLLIIALLSINLHERQMLTDLELTLGQQTRSIVHALATENQITQKSIRNLFEKFPKDYRNRIQVYDTTEARIYNSGNRDWDVGPDPGYLKENWIYKAAGKLFSLFQSNNAESKDNQLPEKNNPLPAEIRSAFEGRPSFAIQRSAGAKSPVIIHAAFPIFRANNTLVGVVRVSRSANRVLTAVYQIRLTILHVFLWSLFAVIILNLVISLTIIRPIKQLIKRTSLNQRSGNPDSYAINPLPGRDEISKLSQVLSHFTSELEKEILVNREFVDDVVHELKNPLTAIRSASEMAKETENQADKDGFLKMISEDVSRMEHLLSSVKELSRIKSENVDDPKDPIEIIPLLTSYLGHKRSHSRIDIRWSLKVLPTALVEIDPDKLIQCFDNLIQNAISFSPENQPIEVEVRPSGHRIEIAILDHGPGISNIHQAKIFNRFYSIRPDQQKKNHTGLGLAIAKSIVNSAGGDIRFHNAHPHGACFIIELPCRRQA